MYKLAGTRVESKSSRLTDDFKQNGIPQRCAGHRPTDRAGLLLALPMVVSVLLVGLLIALAPRHIAHRANPRPMWGRGSGQRPEGRPPSPSWRPEASRRACLRAHLLAGLILNRPARSAATDACSYWRVVDAPPRPSPRDRKFAGPEPVRQNADGFPANVPNLGCREVAGPRWSPRWR